MYEYVRPLALAKVNMPSPTPRDCAGQSAGRPASRDSEEEPPSKDASACDEPGSETAESRASAIAADPAPLGVVAASMRFALSRLPPSPGSEVAALPPVGGLPPSPGSEVAALPPIGEL